MQSTTSPGTLVHTLWDTHAHRGGPSRSVPALCSALASKGLDTHLYARMDRPHESVLPLPPVRIDAAPHGKDRLRDHLGFGEVLTELLRELRLPILHDHGVWLPANFLAAQAARKVGVPYIVSPRGMLLDWSVQYRKGRKRLAWWFYQRQVLQQAAALHATSEEEVEGLRRRGLKVPIACIPNGVDLPPLDFSINKERKSFQALFLSRIHPKKGLPLLLEVWAALKPPHWLLRIVGPDEDGHRNELQQLSQHLGIGDVVLFQDEVPNEEKWAVYAAADLFVLPSYSENFGLVVAEAMAAGLPVLTTTGTPWTEIEQHGAGWWIPPRIDTLREALFQAVSMTSAERTAMGQRGRSLVQARYGWDHIASDMLAFYYWLWQRGSKPSFVSI